MSHLEITLFNLMKCPFLYENKRFKAYPIHIKAEKYNHLLDEHL
jgi:hypothetical protein